MKTVRCFLVAGALFTALSVYAAPGSIYFKTADGKWRPLAATQDRVRGVITFTLDPAQIKGGATMVVFDLPQGICLEDSRPPLVTGLKLDARPLKDAPGIDLDWLPSHPQALTVGLADADNALDPSSLRVRVNGRALDATQSRLIFTDDSRKRARLQIPLGDLVTAQGLFTNTVDFAVTDLSPERNRLSRSLTYRVLGEVKEEPLLLVDTCCPGYENLQVLLDGKVMTPGETTYGCTWASEEQPGDHWLVMAWPQEREIRGAEIFWASYQGIYWAPRLLHVQTWDGQKWVTRQTLRDLEPKRSTVIEFDPVKSSRVRFFQPDGQGHPSRANIMWLTEVKLL